MALPNQLTSYQKAQFFFQFAALLDAGMTLEQSLTLTGKNLHPAFKQYLHYASTAVGTGQDLASVLALERRYFDLWTIALIRLAEYSGCLSQTCQMLASDAEAQGKRERLIESVKRSVIIAIWGLLVLTAAIFNPNATGIVKPEFWLRGLAIALLLWVMSFFVSRFSSPVWQQLIGKLPVLGKLIQARSLLYFAKLRLPLSCGISLLSALELLREHIPDSVMKSKLAFAARRTRIGQPLSHSLQGQLPPVAMQIISTGEQTGNLDTALQNLAQYYEGELERGLQLLQASLQPLSLLTIGSLIAVVGIRGISVLLNSLPK
ncbi:MULTISPECIES: type II secretion system F family protein [unclassified Coleofasciculus]|uniref:type II secretion system F family protein n=1 Tax=unclassified Coleofasciculus TaxID=2692782 RepID=UPI00187FC986|nr:MULTISPECIES: type II secretion system F family protein [unclassified Coleofasciculus]MBE9129906.1 type II secretion system F family protein [Coleofasciculus sp. LEGE 07081]MBE9151770.1 type II secretion system F family protein [Coleofasciculus sp. LEGE 07092]